MTIEEWAGAVFSLYKIRTNAVAVKTYRDIKRTKKYCFSSEDELIGTISRDMVLDDTAHNELVSLFGNPMDKRLLFRNINNLYRSTTSGDSESLKAQLLLLEERVKYLEELVIGE